MEDNLSVLVDAKTEYTKQLTTILVPFIYDGIKSIYDETLEYCRLNDDKSILMRFQEKLSLIPKWNQDLLSAECIRIMDGSGCDWLDELVTAVFLSHTKILTAIKKNNKKQKKINLKIPKIDHFIHKCYIECAREFWRNPYLYSDKCAQYEYQRNVRESQKIISRTIEETIRKLLPVKNILKEYLGEDEDSDKDTSFISDSYRDNLRKIVKKEIEICQGKSDMSINGQSDSELITEESENLEKQKELDTIKEIISTELYEKDLTGDENDNIIDLNITNDVTDNIIDLDDIEEISLALNNKIDSKIAEEKNNSPIENALELTKEPSVELAKETSVEPSVEPSVETSVETSVELAKETAKESLEDNLNDYSEDEIDISTLNLKKMGLNSLNIEEINFDDFDIGFVNEPLVEINEDNSINNESSNVEETNLAETNLAETNLAENSAKENSAKENSAKENSAKENSAKETNLEETNLEENNVEETNLEETNLEETNLEENNVEENNVEETNLEENNVEETNLAENNIKKIVIDNVSSLKKYTKDIKKNYSFFD